MTTDTATPVIDLTPCVSSQVAAYGYEAATCTLAVKFNTGGALYHYHDVPAEVHEQMKTAESVGSFFTKSIRNKFAYTKQPDSEGITYGLPLAQEPKYTASSKTGRIVNRSTGKPIPDFEPVFILRGQDEKAIYALRAYANLVSDPEHAQALALRIAAFENFAATHPDLMKEPDTTPMVLAA